MAVGVWWHLVSKRRDLIFWLNLKVMERMRSWLKWSSIPTSTCLWKSDIVHPPVHPDVPRSVSRSHERSWKHWACFHLSFYLLVSNFCHDPSWTSEACFSVFPMVITKKYYVFLSLNPWTFCAAEIVSVLARWLWISYFLFHGVRDLSLSLVNSVIIRQRKQTYQIRLGLHTNACL